MSNSLIKDKQEVLEFLESFEEQDFVWGSRFIDVEDKITSIKQEITMLKEIKDAGN